MNRPNLLWVPLLVAVISSGSWTQDPIPKSYICYKALDPIIIDGELMDPSWQKAQWTDLFVDIEGDKKPVPRFHTRAKMLWDSAYFYIAAELQEPDVWATITRRDEVIFHDNDFEVFIDPDGDTHQYYEFEMNALNTVWDLLLIKPYRDGGPAVNAWDIQGLKTAVRVRGTINHPGDVDSGWTVELAFPWKVLKECAQKDVPPKSGDQWKLNFSRVEWRIHVRNGEYEKTINPERGTPFPEDNWVWSPQGVIDMHFPEMWGFIQFSEKFIGSGLDQFVYRREERAKWALRQVYYREQEFFAKNGRYSTSVLQLGFGDQSVEGYAWPPSIQVTASMYEAIIQSTQGKQRWHICQDGRTWTE